MTTSDTTESSQGLAVPPDLVASLADTLDVLIDQPLIGMTLVGGEPPAVGRYIIERRLGVGATSIVYAARDTTLDRPVALKIVARHDVDGAWRERILHEARVLASLPHHNIVAVYDVGEWRGHPFIAMELVDGVPLAHWQTEEPRAWRMILRRYLAAGRGLEVAHSRRLVHRDFKPANVLVADSGRRVVVTDFGLAVLAEPTAEQAGVAVKAAGTPAYLAPEQRAGAPPRPSADVYSFSVALCEALVGRHPLLASAPDGQRALDQIGLPHRLRVAIERGMVGDPAQRWPGMTPLLAAIEAALCPSPSWRRRATSMVLMLVIGLTDDQAGPAPLSRPHESRPAPSETVTSRPPGEPPLDPDSVLENAYEEVIEVTRSDPQLLTQASVTWTKRALDSQDRTMRLAGASVLPDLPEREAVALLPAGLGDPEPDVRRAIARSAGKLKCDDAAAQLIVAVKAEVHPSVKEQQIIALGEIGSPVARDTLTRLAAEPGRIGAIAAGALIAVGDPSGKARLEVAIGAPQAEVRLAAVQAAATARNPIVIPMLKLGVTDRVFRVRFTAAEGLALFNAEKAAAVPVLTMALQSGDAGVLGRALAALIKFGEQIEGESQRTAELLDSRDPRLRLVAVSIVRELPPDESVPLLRRLVADREQDVRCAGVDAIESLAIRNRKEAMKLYKSLLGYTDPVVRSKASGQLARLVRAPEVAAMPDVEQAFRETFAAVAEVTKMAHLFRTLDKTFIETLEASHDDTMIARLEELAAGIGDAAAKLAAAAAKVELAVKTATDDAGADPSPGAAKLVDKVKALAQRASEAAAAARAKAKHAERQAQSYKKTWTGDPQLIIAGAKAALATGDLAGARQNLERAAKLSREPMADNTSLDYLDTYAKLHDRMAAETRDPAVKLKLLRQAEKACRQLARVSRGRWAQLASARLAEIVEKIAACSDDLDGNAIRR